MTNPNIAKRKQRETEQRRKMFTDSAKEVILTEGLQALTIRRISDEMAYSLPVLMSLFGNKAGLLEAVLASMNEEEKQQVKKQYITDMFSVYARANLEDYPNWQKLLTA